MSIRNCSSQFNNPENLKVCADNINDKVPLSPMDKVAAFSIFYGVLFLVSVVGEQENLFPDFPSKGEYSGMINYVFG